MSESGRVGERVALWTAKAGQVLIPISLPTGIPCMVAVRPITASGGVAKGQGGHPEPNPACLGPAGSAGRVPLISTRINKSRLVMLREIAPRQGKNRPPAAMKPRVFIMGFPGMGQAGKLDDLNALRPWHVLGQSRMSVYRIKDGTAKPRGRAIGLSA